MSFFPRTSVESGTSEPHSDAKQVLDPRKYITNYLLNFNFMDDPCKFLEYAQPTRASQNQMLPPFAYTQKPVVNVAHRFMLRFRYNIRDNSRLNPQSILSKEKRAPSMVYWLPQGKWLFFTQNNYLNHVDLEQYMKDGKFNPINDTESAFTAIRATHNSQWIYFGTNNGSLVKYYKGQGTFVPKYRTNLNHDKVKGIAFSPSDRKYAVACYQFVGIFDIDNPDPESTFTEHKCQVTACDWHPYTSLVFTGDDNGNLHIQDPREKKFLFERQDTNTINTISCNTNGNWVLIGSNKSVKLFDIRTQSYDRTFTLNGTRFLSSQWDPCNESQFITTTDLNSIYYWNANYMDPIDSITCVYREQLRKMENKKQPIPHVVDSSIHPMGGLMATTNYNGEIIIWSRSVPGDKEELEYNKMFHFKASAIPSKIPTLKRIPDNYICEICRDCKHLPGKCPKKFR